MATQEIDYSAITKYCITWAVSGDGTALELLEALMDLPGVPMHDPIHHYIMPAALLTLAARKSRISGEALLEKLNTAEERARKVLPGFCGWWGSCGSAVGCGIFASVWLGANPKKEEHWAAINAFTAGCLAQVSSVGGPRCCKRTSYLALTAALREAPALLGIDLGTIPRPICTWSAFNMECRKEQCPFYSPTQSQHNSSQHIHLKTCRLN